MAHFPLVSACTTHQHAGVALQEKYYIGPGAPNLSAWQHESCLRFVRKNSDHANQVVDRIRKICNTVFTQPSTIDLKRLVALLQEHAHEIQEVYTSSSASWAPIGVARYHTAVRHSNNWELILCLLLYHSELLPKDHPQNPKPYMTLKIADHVCLSDGSHHTTSKSVYYPVRVAWSIKNNFFTEPLYRHFVLIAATFRSLSQQA